VLDLNKKTVREILEEYERLAKTYMNRIRKGDAADTFLYEAAMMSLDLDLKRQGEE